MLTKEDLLAIQQIIQTETKPINERLDKLQENLTEVREAVNYIADWVEQVEKKVDSII